MKLNKELEIVKIADINEFQVGNEVKLENITMLEKSELIECNINPRLDELEFDKNKSYPGLNVIGDFVNSQYKDLCLIEEDVKYKTVTLTPIFVMNIKNGQLEFIFNDKGKLKYSDHFRDLQNKVDEWVVGYINDERLFTEMDIGNYYKSEEDISLLGEDNHVYMILLKIMENPELDFRYLSFTEYDIAKEIHEGRLSYDELNQKTLNNYRFNS